MTEHDRGADHQSCDNTAADPVLPPRSVSVINKLVAGVATILLITSIVLLYMVDTPERDGCKICKVWGTQYVYVPVLVGIIFTSVVAFKRDGSIEDVKVIRVLRVWRVAMLLFIMVASLKNVFYIDLETTDTTVHALYWNLRVTVFFVTGVFWWYLYTLMNRY